MTSRYDDIINLPHHVSPTRPRMSVYDRAAQFAPFAALVGYDDAVAETARLTENRPALDEQEQESINAQLSWIAGRIGEQPEVCIRYFVPDDRKKGGTVVAVSGRVRRISADKNTLVLTNNDLIPIGDIVEILTLK